MVLAARVGSRLPPWVPPDLAMAAVWHPGCPVWGPADMLGVPPAPPPDRRPGTAHVVNGWVEAMLLQGWWPTTIKMAMKDSPGSEP